MLVASIEAEAKVLRPLPLPDVSKISLGDLGNLFYRISESTAMKLCRPHPLPSQGHFLDIVYDGFQCEIHKTFARDGSQVQPVWAIMITSRRALRYEKPTTISARTLKKGDRIFNTVAAKIKNNDHNHWTTVVDVEKRGNQVFVEAIAFNTVFHKDEGVFTKRLIQE